jgi:hypothetical protein
VQHRGPRTQITLAATAARTRAGQTSCWVCRVAAADQLGPDAVQVLDALRRASPGTPGGGIARHLVTEPLSYRLPASTCVVCRQRHARLVRRPLAWRRAAHRSSAACVAAFVSFGEALGLPVVHIAYPLPARLSRWADPRVTDNLIVTQGLHVRPVLVDPCA